MICFDEHEIGLALQQVWSSFHQRFGLFHDDGNDCGRRDWYPTKTIQNACYRRRLERLKNKNKKNKNSNHRSEIILRKVFLSDDRHHFLWMQQRRQQQQRMKPTVSIVEWHCPSPSTTTNLNHCGDRDGTETTVSSLSSNLSQSTTGFTVVLEEDLRVAEMVGHL